MSHLHTEKIKTNYKIIINTKFIWNSSINLQHFHRKDNPVQHFHEGSSPNKCCPAWVQHIQSIPRCAYKFHTNLKDKSFERLYVLPASLKSNPLDFFNYLLLSIHVQIHQGLVFRVACIPFEI